MSHAVGFHSSAMTGVSIRREQLPRTLDCSRSITRGTVRYVTFLLSTHLLPLSHSPPFFCGKPDSAGHIHWGLTRLIIQI